MFGLISCEESEKFSLRSVTVKCDISNLLVTCSSEFIYKNDSGHNAEAFFTFPLEGTCVVYYFEAVIGGKKIVGLCKEIEEARNMYKAAKEAGNKTALIERNWSMMDVFKCRIGNIPKDSDASITLKFAMELNLSLSKSECIDNDRFSLCLPLILRPRYTPADYVGDDEIYQVNNKYDYKFQAKIRGTKEIKNIFSNNYQLKSTFIDERKTQAETTLESVYDGTHDLDVNIDYVKMKVPSVIYEYGTSSNKFKGTKVHGVFYQNDVAMLQFLPDFEKNSERIKKLEVVFLIDRSGSMSGSNIQHAKECLLIILKSLPTNCKFQIYGFGTTFDKVFSKPELYQEQSMEIALNYQRNIDADFGGTELMNPLKDLYSSSLTNDYTRIVFLLTDGDVGNQDEVFKLVRQHNKSTKLFTVGIGEGVSTSLVQKVAESGYGKSVFVRDSKALSSSVIELLDIALNCDQFTDCKIEWQCPKDASVVMVPSNPGPIFSNYFLTVFCMINGLKEGQSIKCHLSGKVNDKSISLSLDVNDKEGISDDEFRVHRLLAKYKIDEMTPQIEDYQEDLKKSLIELSLEVNMVTNYTTFVAIDQDAPAEGLTFNDEGDYEMSSCDIAYDSVDYGTNFGNIEVFSMMECAEDEIYDLEEESYKYDDDGTSGNCLSQCMGKSGMEKEVAYKCEPENQDIVFNIAEKQNINGSWKIDEKLVLRMGLELMILRREKPASINEEVWMTVIVYRYLMKKLSSREKEWRLFAKKALQWIENSINDRTIMEDVMEKGSQMI